MGPATARSGARGEGRIAFRTTWDFFQRLAEAIGEQPVRLAFADGMVEMTSPGPLHESQKTRLDRLVVSATEARGLPCKGMGSTRWERPSAWRGLEADLTYYLTREKIRAASARSNDAADYPIPDLAIEIDLSPSQLDRPSIYAALGVPEVWRFDGDVMHFERLDPSGAYVGVAESPLLHLRPEEVAHWLVEVDEEDDNLWTARFRAWAVEHLAGR